MNEPASIARFRIGKRWWRLALMSGGSLDKTGDPFAMVRQAEVDLLRPPFSTLMNVLIEMAAGKPLRPIPGWMPAEIAEIIEAAQRELRVEPT
jgi:hypothetical protein